MRVHPGVSAKQLAKYDPTVVPQANPAQSLQQNTPGNPLCRTPLLIGSEHGNTPIGGESEFLAISPATADKSQVSARDRQPSDRHGQPCPYGCRQDQDDQDARSASSTPDQRTTRRRSGSGWISAKYAVDDTRDRLRRRRLPLQQIRVQFGVGKLENCAERRFIVIAIARVILFEIAQEKLVELAHSAPALPPEARFLAQYFLSTSIFLVSAMA